MGRNCPARAMARVIFKREKAGWPAKQAWNLLPVLPCGTLRAGSGGEWSE